MSHFIRGLDQFVKKETALTANSTVHYSVEKSSSDNFFFISDLLRTIVNIN